MLTLLCADCTTIVAKPQPCENPAISRKQRGAGGEQEIRTLGRGLPYNGFQDRHLRPLGQLSSASILPNVTAMLKLGPTPTRAKPATVPGTRIYQAPCAGADKSSPRTPPAFVSSTGVQPGYADVADVDGLRDRYTIGGRVTYPTGAENTCTKRVNGQIANNNLSLIHI